MKKEKAISELKESAKMLKGCSRGKNKILRRTASRRSREARRALRIEGNKGKGK